MYGRGVQSKKFINFEGKSGEFKIVGSKGGLEERNDRFFVLERSRQNATYARTRCAKVSRSRIGRVMAPQCSRTAALRNDSLLPRHRISKKIREKDKIHIGVKDKLIVQ